MPQCPHCSHDYGAKQAAACPSCGQELAESPRASDGGSADVPAPKSGPDPHHLAVLKTGGSDPLLEVAQTPKQRLVSTAGPSVPVRRRQIDDTVPATWSARVRAVQRFTAGSQQTSPMAVSALAADKKPEPKKEPEPAPPARDVTGKVKPAHLLVAELEAEEAEKREAEDARAQAYLEEDMGAEIAEVEITPEVPAAKPRRVPEWLIISVLALGVLGGLAAVYAHFEEKKRESAVEVDPKLELAKKKREKALAALEEGHTWALQGKAQANKAIAAYQRALALEPKLSGAERGLAIAYASLEQRAEAVKHYRRYLDLEPNAQDADEVRQIIDRYEKAQSQ